MSRHSSVPSYRRHKQSGQAIVTLTDGLGNRRDVLLGKHGTADSRQEYLRVIAEWEANGRRLAVPGASAGSLTVSELMLAYWQFAEGYYLKNGEPTKQLDRVKRSLRPVKELYGRTLVKDFGPLALKAVREQMVKIGWVRRYVNSCVGCVKRMFKWGVENEMVPPSVYHGLQAVAGLKKGRSSATEGRTVRPVADEHVDSTLPFMTPPVRAMVQVQRLAGMRPGEVVAMRPCDIDRSRKKVWVYRPDSHKTEHHGHERAIFLGPQAQEILRPFLFAPFLQDETAIRLAGAAELDGAAAAGLSDRLAEIGSNWRHPGAYLFSPQESMADFRPRQRRTRKSKVQPSQVDRKKAKAKKRPQKRYRVDSYGHSVCRSCAKAGVPHWHPHQLRHSAATEIRREAGLDAARAVLGHRSPSITEVYAEVDAGKAAAIMERLG